MGTAGLLTTVFYTFLPSFYFIFAGAPLIERSHKNNFIKNSLSIVTAAVVGIILNLSIYFGEAVIFPGQRTLNSIDFFSVIWIIISLIVLYKYNFSAAVWILISALAGLIHFLIF